MRSRVGHGVATDFVGDGSDAPPWEQPAPFPPRLLSPPSSANEPHQRQQDGGENLQSHSFEPFARDAISSVSHSGHPAFGHLADWAMRSRTPIDSRGKSNVLARVPRKRLN